jgi:hypothetical protein
VHTLGRAGRTGTTLLTYTPRARVSGESFLWVRAATEEAQSVQWADRSIRTIGKEGPDRMKRTFVAAVIVGISIAPDAQAQGICAGIEFSGYCWTIKDSAGSTVGPGPNIFSKDNAWVDGAGLHLEIANRGDTWTCAEVIAQASLGYGTYRATYGTRVDAFDPNVVLALFTWSDSPAYAHREIDIEFSRWGVPNNLDAEYVVQPSTRASRIHRFGLPGAATSNHSFTWTPGAVLFQSYAGDTRATSTLLQEWRVASRSVPVPGGENPRMNLWLFQGSPPSDGQPVEVIVSKFEWVP